MLRKYQLLKKLIPSSTKSFALGSSKPSFFPFSCPSPHHSFSTSKINDYKGDLHLLNNFSPEHKAYTSKIMDKYASHREDLTQMTSDDIQWMFSGLYHLSLAHVHAGNHQKAYDCLFETDYIFRKLGIKDTIDVALNYYDMSSILIAQKKLVEAKNNLTEVDRICKLLGEDPQAKSLTVQNWHLLAQVESHTSLDRALELYNAVLKNISDINQTALPAILLSVHKEMREIYRSRGDIDKMIKSCENGFQAAKKYFGEDHSITFNFLLELVQDLALQNQNARAEPYAQNCLKMALKIYPNPHEKVAMIYSLLGNIYMGNKRHPEAAQAYDEALKIFAKLPKDYPNLLHDIYFNMATAQGSLGLHQQASDFLTKADQALIKAQGKPNLSVAAVYYRWGSDLRIFKMSTASQEYYWKALELYKALDPSNRSKIFSIYSGLGEIHFTEGNWGKALEAWKEAEKYLDPTDHRNIQLVNFVLDRTYYKLENPEEGEKHVQRLLQSCGATGDTSFVYTNYYANGEHLEKQGKFEEALPCYEIAARVYEKDAKKDPVKAQNLAAKISQIKQKL